MLSSAVSGAKNVLGDNYASAVLALAIAGALDELVGRSDVTAGGSTQCASFGTQLLRQQDAIGNFFNSHNSLLGLDRLARRQHFAYVECSDAPRGLQLGDRL
jgi:hypothetical protein